jgi:vitamin K-dependent gamma-carboxylase
MKLLDLQGDASFIVTDPAQRDIWEVNPSDYLADWQIHEMIQRPDMTLQFSHYLAEVFRQQGHTQIEVRAQVMVSLNGRPPQLMIDPDTDLAAQPRTLTSALWLLSNASVEN